LSAAIVVLSGTIVYISIVGDLAVPQDPHGNTRVHVKSREQRAAGTAGVVYANAPHASPCAAQIKAAANRTRLDRTAGARGEHQAVAGPGATAKF
jgi:hypothetical protein